MSSMRGADGRAQSDAGSSHRLRNLLVLALRAMVGVAMLTILMRRVDVDTLFPKTANHLTALHVTLGLVLMLASFVLAAWRWQRVLAVLGDDVRLTTLSSFYLAGQFVGNFLPSTIGDCPAPT